ncbi:MAG: DUF4115 domain-containing protein [Deltaproteobacteria bacterium]
MTTEIDADSPIVDLKKARENTGLTLKDFFERTRISVVNLEAIENGRYHLLPVPIYARNFIKMYTEALGVDSKPILERYENYLQTIQMKEKTKVTEEPHQTPLVATLGRHKTALWVLCIVIVLIAVSFIVSSYNRPVTDVSPIAETPKPAAMIDIQGQNSAQPDKLPVDVNLPTSQNLIAVNQAGTDAKQPGQNTVEEPTASAPPKDEAEIEALIDDEESSRLVVHATEDTWIRIQADNKEPFQVLLKPGEKISHTAARFSMDIGNAGGVRIQFKGKNIENLGKSGQVIHLRLP